MESGVESAFDRLDRTVELEVNRSEKRADGTVGKPSGDHRGAYDGYERHQVGRYLVTMHQIDRHPESNHHRVPVGLATNRAMGDVAQRAVRGSQKAPQDVGELPAKSTVGVVHPHQRDDVAHLLTLTR